MFLWEAGGGVRGNCGRTEDSWYQNNIETVVHSKLKCVQQKCLSCLKRALRPEIYYLFKLKCKEALKMLPGTLVSWSWPTAKYPPRCFLILPQCAVGENQQNLANLGFEMKLV